MKSALHPHATYPREDYRADLAAHHAPTDDADKGNAWPVFLVLVFAVAFVFIAGAWLIVRIVWGVVV